MHSQNATIEVARSSVVTIEDLTFDYVGRSESVPVLDKVSLSVDAGEWVAVMGASGSGKTTLLRCAAGLSPAFSGHVVLDGLRVETASDRQLTELRRDRIGFVFQEFNLVSALTAEENVGLPARFGGRRRSKEQIKASLEQVGIGDKGNRRPDQLSGGERQRVAIARALVTVPRVVFADEPTGALDIRVRDQVLDLFGELAAQGAGVMMVTHDPLVAARADRVLWLARGRIVEMTSKETAEQIALRLAAIEADAL